MNEALADVDRRIVGTKQLLRALDEGKIAAGFRQVMRAIAQGKAARIYVAQDAQESIRAQAIAAAEAAGVPVEQAESMAVLGPACRISVSCAAAAVLK